MGLSLPDGDASEVAFSGAVPCTVTPCLRANSKIVARASLLGLKRPFSHRLTVPTVMPRAWANSSCVMPIWRLSCRMNSLMLFSMVSLRLQSPAALSLRSHECSSKRYATVFFLACVTSMEMLGVKSMAGSEF